MRTTLLSLLVLAALSILTSAAPLDKVIDEFNQILGLDVPKPSKKSLQKKGKPPGKQPGPKLSLDSFTFGFLPQIPTNVITKITGLVGDDDDKKKHPLKGEPKMAPLREDGNRKGTFHLADPPSQNKKAPKEIALEKPVKVNNIKILDLK